MRKNLVFLSERYPFQNLGGVWEANEVNNLAPLFDKVFVIGATADQKLPPHVLPPGAKPSFWEPDRGRRQKLWSLRLIFTRIFFAELSFIRSTLKQKITYRTLAVLLTELNAALALSRHIERMMQRNSLEEKDTLLYAFWNDYRAIACALLKKKHPGYAAISRSHGGDVFFELHTGNYLPLKHFMLEQLNFLFTIADFSRDYLIKKLKDTSGKIITKKLGVVNQYPFEKNSNTGILKVVSCSQIDHNKRLELIIGGIKRLGEIQVEWYHIGEDELDGQLMNLAAQELGPAVIHYEFLGMMPNEKVFAFYHQTKPDLFINASKSEGLPVSVMEAMSFGIPVIATAVGGTPEIVKDGYNGFLLRQDPTAEEIAEAIKKYYFLPENEKIIMRENAYKTWDEEYNSEKNNKVFAEMIGSL
ncbi:MAG TPA: glycosyltransferase [Bacteroidales bacterium]|nr:glycosyltransferase [Bacteroidales bacterium]